MPPFAVVQTLPLAPLHVPSPATAVRAALVECRDVAGVDRIATRVLMTSVALLALLRPPGNGAHIPVHRAHRTRVFSKKNGRNRRATVDERVTRGVRERPARVGAVSGAVSTDRERTGHCSNRAHEQPGSRRSA